MRPLLGKMRSILSTSAFGGVLGAAFGGALLGVGAIVSPGEVTAGLFALGVGLTGAAGGFIGGAFGALLALSERRSLDELSLGRSAVLGALAGAPFPIVAAVLTGGWLIPLVPAQLTFLGSVFGVGGAVLSAGLVAVAKDADDAALSPGAPIEFIEARPPERAEERKAP